MGKCTKPPKEQALIKAERRKSNMEDQEVFFWGGELVCFCYLGGVACLNIVLSLGVDKSHTEPSYPLYSHNHYRDMAVE